LQTSTEKPVPILTGNAGAFSFVSGGQQVIDTQINPVLLVPLGDRWLVEARADSRHCMDELEAEYGNLLTAGAMLRKDH